MTRGRLNDPGGIAQDIGEFKLKLPCPCGQTVRVFEYAVLHGMPMCADFNDRSLPDYLAWLRKRAEKTEAT